MKLIYAHSSTGHYPEYIHHLYTGICKRENIRAIFVVPAAFRQKMAMFEWPVCDRIQWDFVPDEELPWSAWYKRNFQFCRVLCRKIRQYHPDESIVLNLEMLMPFLAWMAPRRTKISGILYEIYPYRWNSLSSWRKMAAVVWHRLYAKLSQFHHVFTLNDKSAANFFNHRWHTDHFRFLPDPFNPIRITAPEDFRQKYALGDKKIILHFGSMGRKKGTLEILKAILAMPKEEASRYAFVFAGVVQPVIRDEFYQLYEKAKSAAKILVFDEFCSYEFIGNWCAACDAILLPYLETYNSSGCIGYAAQFGKPVIAPRSGLLGKLVRKNCLGILMNDVSSESIRCALGEIEKAKISRDYLSTNSVENFCHHILD